MKDWTKKNWRSLSDLRDYLEKNTKVKIKDFDGITLRTSKGDFAIAFGELFRIDNREEKK